MLLEPTLIAGILTSVYIIIGFCFHAFSFTMKGILRAVLYRYSFWHVYSGRVCTACGLKIAKPDALFCPNCGAKIEMESIRIPERSDEFSSLNSFLRAYV